MSYTPAQELIKILRPAYCPCPGFKGACRGTATWKPSVGHVPRAFIGALGRLSEIKVVILVSEPGDPHYSLETYRGPNKLEQTCEYTFQAIENGTDRFHKRLKYPVFPILGVLRLNGQSKRDDGMIFGSCKAIQSPVYPIRDAILAVNHASCPSLSSSGPRQWGESALKTSRLPGALSLLARSWLYPPSTWCRR